MENTLNSAKKLKGVIRDFVLNGKNKEELYSGLDLFFKGKSQKDIDKVDADDIKLFSKVQDILRNFKGSEIEMAKIDLAYSRNGLPLKYCWKEHKFSMKTEEKNFLEVLGNLLKKGDFDEKKKKEMLDFINEIRNGKWWFENTDIEDKISEVYITVDFVEFEDDKPEAYLFLLTNKKHEDLLKLIPE